MKTQLPWIRRFLALAVVLLLLVTFFLLQQLR